MSFREYLAEQQQLIDRELERLVPPLLLSLEQTLEFCREDECVEVTPAAVRLRKVELGATARQKLSRTRARARA